MLLYRVDKRDFAVEEIISHDNGLYQDGFNEDKRQLEEWLDRVRPTSIPSRSNILFLFINLSDALSFWARYGGNVYQVRVQGAIYHRADMNKLDNLLDIIRFSEDQDLYQAAANEYWKAGTHTFGPSYEILCESAEVMGILLNETDCYSFQLELAQYNYIERTPTYINLLKSFTM